MTNWVDKCHLNIVVISVDLVNVIFNYVIVTAAQKGRKWFWTNKGIEFNNYIDQMFSFKYKVIILPILCNT